MYNVDTTSKFLRKLIEISSKIHLIRICITIHVENFSQNFFDRLDRNRTENLSQKNTDWVRGRSSPIRSSSSAVKCTSVVIWNFSIFFLEICGKFWCVFFRDGCAATALISAALPQQKLIFAVLPQNNTPDIFWITLLFSAFYWFFKLNLSR